MVAVRDMGHQELAHLMEPERIRVFRQQERDPEFRLVGEYESARIAPVRVSDDQVGVRKPLPELLEHRHDLLGRDAHRKGDARGLLIGERVSVPFERQGAVVERAGFEQKRLAGFSERGRACASVEQRDIRKRSRDTRLPS
jgi:hypothetical protein